MFSFSVFSSSNVSHCLSSFSFSLLFFGEEDGADAGEELLVHEVEAGQEGVVALDLAVQRREEDPAGAGVGQVLAPLGVHLDHWGEGDARFALDDVHVLLHGGIQDRLHGLDVLLPGEDDDLVLLDLDEALDDELLEELGVVAPPGHDRALGGGLAEQGLEKLVADLHLLHPALADLGRPGDALLDLPVLLLLRELVLDVQLRLVDESLLLQVEVVFGLFCLFVFSGREEVGKG
jgi:hypothetical protein